MRLHRFCPKTKYSTCAAPQKVVGLCKVVAPKLRFCTQHSSLTTILFQNHFPKAASQTCYQLLSKDVNCSKFNLSNIKTKTAPHSYAGQRLPKSCAPELLRLPPGSCFRKRLQMFFSTATPQSCCSSRKMSFSAAVPQSAFAKQRPQSGSTSNLFRPSYYPQWLPKSASQTCHDYRTSIQTWFVRQSCGSSKLLPPKDVPLCFSTNKCQKLFSKRP